jgi:hypothetical protein
MQRRNLGCCWEHLARALPWHHPVWMNAVATIAGFAAKASDAPATVVP